MRAIRVERPDKDRAVVFLQPSWLARMFGARLLRCEVWRRPGDTDWYGQSGRRNGYMEHGALILAALDASPVDDVTLPRAEVVR